MIDINDASHKRQKYRKARKSIIGWMKIFRCKKRI